MTAMCSANSNIIIYAILIASKSGKQQAGFINTSGEIVIAPQFEDARSSINGIASVRKRHLWGCIDIHGTEVVSPLSGGDLVYSEERAIFSSASGNGAIDDKGRVRVPPTYNRLLPYVSGMACATSMSWRSCGFIDKEGKSRIPFLFEDGRSFSNGMAAVKRNNKWGFINEAGQLAIDFQFDGSSAGPFSNGLARVCKAGKWGYIDLSGHIAISPRFDMALEFTNGLARIKDALGFYGFINTTGDIKIPAIFGSARKFEEGLCVAMSAGHPERLFGYINERGEWSIPAQWKKAGRFYGGLAYVETEGYMGYINKNGEFVWRCPRVPENSLDLAD
jgi:hypothetical protein